MNLDNLNTIMRGNDRPVYSQTRALIDVHIDPRKRDTVRKTDPGANTKTAFMDVVACLAKALPDCELLPDRTKCVVTLSAPSGKTINVSVKSGCSTLSSSVNGRIQLLPKIDFIIYAPDFSLEKDALSQMHVFTKQEFLEMWDSLGLIRKKVSLSAMKYYRELYGPDFKTNIDQHADVISVQSFSNSGKKSKLVQQACEEKPPFILDGIDILKRCLMGNKT